MTTIREFPIVSHLRAEPTSHILRFRNGERVSSTRGGGFWFLPLSTTIADVPVEDREQSFLFPARSADFQDVTVQGTVTYRVQDPALAARRIDFSIDLTYGNYRGQPLERLAQMVTLTAQQATLDWVAHRSLDDVLREAVQDLRPLLAEELNADASLADLGLKIASVRVTRVSPTPDLEKALQAPTRERLQQSSDEATFQRRALAVEKERAIAENELANQIELTKREADLIEQRGTNERSRAQDESDAKRIEAISQAERAQLGAKAKAVGLRLVEAANNEAEQARIEIYRDLAPAVLIGLAAQELAGKLEHIEHLNLSPDVLGPMLQSLMAAGTKKLDA